MDIFKKLKTQNSLIVLLGIILVGLFFRIFRLTQFYIFEHDQDLYSWIVKDILIEHHHRLIGQVTSIEGLFIGSGYYYLLTPFYALFNMSPVAATIPATLIGVATIFSIYFVFNKFFGKTVGLLGAFLYTVSLGTTFFDRWVVPTQPTNIWVVWFLYVIFSILKGERKNVILVLALLVGLTWHIHVALIPLFILVPISLIFSKKKVTLKEFILFTFLTILFLSPFILFELKNDFLQIKAFFNSAASKADLTGLPRLIKVFEASSIFLSNTLYWQVPIPYILIYPILSCLLILSYLKKMLIKYQVVLIIIWVGVVWLGQFLSKRGISEYYFANLTTISILLAALGLSLVYKFNKKLVMLFCLFYLGLNITLFVKMPDAENSYFYKKQAVDFIRDDVVKNNYPCIGVNYIAKYGTAVGFRYLFWVDNVKLIKPGVGEPIYNVSYPWSNSTDPNQVRFGSFGVTVPENQIFDNHRICTDPQNQLLPLLGFTF